MPCIHVESALNLPGHEFEPCRMYYDCSCEVFAFGSEMSSVLLLRWQVGCKVTLLHVLPEAPCKTNVI